MWKISDVQPVSVLGVDGYPYGFDLTDDSGRPLVSFAYTTREAAAAAAEEFERPSRTPSRCVRTLS